MPLSTVSGGNHKREVTFMTSLVARERAALEPEGFAALWLGKIKEKPDVDSIDRQRRNFETDRSTSARIYTSRPSFWNRTLEPDVVSGQAAIDGSR